MREYQPGDPLRRLDWRLTARHPHKFFTKEFEQEEIADIGLILDARQKTNLQIGEDSLFEHAARATASLAEMFLRQGNRVSLLVYQRRYASVFPGYGKLQSTGFSILWHGLRPNRIAASTVSISYRLACFQVTH